jgi:hypothetical protein
VLETRKTFCVKVLNGEVIPPKIVLNIKVDPSAMSVTPWKPNERSRSCY